MSMIEWFPADLLSLVDQFFRVGFDVAFKRTQARLHVEISKAEYLRSGGASCDGLNIGRDCEIQYVS